MIPTDNFRLEPYTDTEIPAAVAELFSFPAFQMGVKSFLPASLSEKMLAAQDRISTAADFQELLVYPFLQYIKESSIISLTTSGLQNLNPDEKYLFISNHRDIVLDSAFLNMVLFDRGMPTSQIAIGDNLMMHRISELLFRINKSFVVRRTGAPRELYQSSLEMSQYVHRLIVDKVSSIWIAQREGRAKDGNDRTQVGLLNMLSMGSTLSLREHFAELNIIPVAIAYELDPCDVLKTQEYLNRLADPDYRKSFQQDLGYMLQGLQGDKGRVHFHFGQQLSSQDLAIMESVTGNKKQLEQLALLLDQQIHAHYQLNPINYIALDLLQGTSDYTAHYTPAEQEQYTDYLLERINQLQRDTAGEGRKYLLSIYANPVINALAAKG